MSKVLSLAELYPKYYKAVPPGVDPSEIDTYVLNMMFPVDDASGCILHARKKLLIPGVRSGGKSAIDDVREARDTLNRYLALHSPLISEPVEDTEQVGDGIEDGQPLGDGWFAHRSDKMPEHFEGDELVEVTLDDEINGVPIQYTGNFAKKAKDWIWLQDGTSTTITAWRLLAIKPVEPQGPDEWKVHDTYYLPEGVDGPDLIEVKFSNGHEAIMAKQAYMWDWAYRQKDEHSAPHISHWRRYRHNAF